MLLVGDSICNGYQEGVRERLKGKVNVSYWVSSYCATSAAYLPLLTIYLDEAKYDVIHFNNGLHSLKTPTDAWAKGFKAALELIRRKQPEAKIVWCTSTPLTDETKTAKCHELNAAGAKVVAELGGIVTNDLFALCDPLDRATNWSDTYHFRREAKAKQADQVAESVLSTLNAQERTIMSAALHAVRPVEEVDEARQSEDTWNHSREERSIDCRKGRGTAQQTDEGMGAFYSVGYPSKAFNAVNGYALRRMARKGRPGDVNLERHFEFSENATF